ncbi:MAG: ABC transporter permease [Stackebrandtia sp.]
MRMMLALSRAGFRRYATYRQATFAATATNTVFGFLRAYVLLATAAAAGGAAAGYSGAQLSTYAWVTQGLLGVVALWGWTDLSDKVRTGEVTADLLRPVNPVWTYLATDMGRAAHAACIRLTAPIAVGALVFPFYWPREIWTYPLFLISMTLAVLVCFAIRYLINLTAFWLLDVRGPNMLWVLASGVGAGLYFPLGFLPDWLAAFLQYGTPFPSIIQFPADVAVERDDVSGQLVRIGVQAFWTVACLALAFAVQRRATRKLVIQGG